jgi:hypothetical protein
MTIQVEVDLRTFVLAIEGRDGEYQRGLYSDDAEICLIGSDTAMPPQVLVGTTALTGWIKQMSSPALTHCVVDVSVAADRLSWTDHCRTAQGLNTLYQSTAELVDGQITKQHVTVIWEDCRPDL